MNTIFILLLCMLAPFQLHGMNNKKRKKSEITTKIPNAKRIKNTDIFDAVKSNDINTIKKLITRGIDVNECKKIDCYSPYSPLDLAAKKGFFYIVKHLIDAGSKIGHKSFFYAIEGGNLPIIKLLLKRAKYNINRSLQCSYRWWISGLNPLYHAMDHGHLQVVKWLLAQGADPLMCGIPHHYYRNTIHEITPRQIAIAYILLKAGAKNLHKLDPLSISPHIKKMAKYFYMLDIQKIRYIINRLKHDISIKKGSTQNNEQLLKNLKTKLQENLVMFDRFVLIEALQQGWSDIMTELDKPIKSEFLSGVAYAVEQNKNKASLSSKGTIELKTKKRYT